MREPFVSMISNYFHLRLLKFFFFKILRLVKLFEAIIESVTELIEPSCEVRSTKEEEQKVRNG